MTSSRLGAIVLAAGKGTRMHSKLPKVMQQLLGEPMLSYVMKAVEQVVPSEHFFVVAGHGADALYAHFPELNGRWVLQEEQLGTGHALQCAWPEIEQLRVEYALVVNGDAPLLSAVQLKKFVKDAITAQADVAFMSITLRDPGGYGRVVRSSDGSIAIVEAKDYDQEIFGPPTGEVNAGVYCLRAATVGPMLQLLQNTNASGEYYLTDLAHLATERRLRVSAVCCGDDKRLMGVNTPQELVEAEDLMRYALCANWMEAGVIIRGADVVRIGPDAVLEPGASITGPCELYGRTCVAQNAEIRSHVWMRDATVMQGAVVHPFSHLEGCTVGESAQAGPYARLRPGAVLENNCRVGNFVEIKKAVLHEGVKVSHLSYIGDAEIGAGTNVGAGTITCNYDGKNKHKTDIGENVFVGSNTALVAPVRIGAGALIGAGSVITKNVEAGQTAIARGRQKNLDRKRRS